MEFEEIEVFFAPNKLYWIGVRDDGFLRSIQVELLKLDILVVLCDISELAEINKEEGLGSRDTVLLNIDFFITSDSSMEKIAATVQKIIHLLKSHNVKECIIHTTMVNSFIGNIVKKEGYLFVEKNLLQKSITVSMLQKIVQWHNQRNNITSRSHLRIQFHPKTQVKISVQNITRPSNTFLGVLKDLSLTGVGLIIPSKEHLGNFQVKDICMVKMNIERSVVKIDKALIRRVDIENLELGLFFNINNINMISDADASAISALVFRVIQRVFDKHGKYFDLNFQHILSKG